VSPSGWRFHKTDCYSTAWLIFCLDIRKIIRYRRKQALGECRPLPGWIWYGSGIWIKTWDPDDFPNLTGPSLSHGTSVIKFSWRYDWLFETYEPKCRDMFDLTELKNQKIPGCGSRWGSLPKFDEFFLVHSYIFGKIFIKIRSLVFARHC